MLMQASKLADQGLKEKNSYKKKRGQREDHYHQEEPTPHLVAVEVFPLGCCMGSHPGYPSMFKGVAIGQVIQA